jgi:hypothetical protein
LIHFAILGNHIHLIAECDDRISLNRGIQGLAIRVARAVNQALSRKRGKVFSDRYHEHVLSTPRETKAAVLYVLQNYRKHCAESGRTLPPRFIDPHSSAIYAAGIESRGMRCLAGTLCDYDEVKGCQVCGCSDVTRQERQPENPRRKN